ncbi:ImuA family protein [Pararhizobium qamdonense]|uniref:ImuA family protein n=1 Tax=Pararhizobium qamdonense TaxID=3031126 RepID=UPI0023E1B35B|nr:ImuA family protein [Pararhizobium qamdonense]
MRPLVDPRLIEALREQVEQIEGTKARRRRVLPFGVPAIDGTLPDGGLALNSTHEFAGGGAGTVMPAAPTLFVAGIAARTKGPVLWILEKNDIYAPALTQAGLHHNRVIYVECNSPEDVLTSAEDALRHGGLGAVILEVPKLDMTASRRLQLVAEKSGTPGLIIRKWRRLENARDFGNPTASLTKWRISPLPSAPLPVPGVGQHRWLVELMRARQGTGADWEIEACDSKGKMELVRHDSSRGYDDRYEDLPVVDPSKWRDTG